jgi:hypothetical protein
MQGKFKQIVQSGEAEAWLEERKQFVLKELQPSNPEELTFEMSIIEESDEEEIPEGHVLAVLTF